MLDVLHNSIRILKGAIHYVRDSKVKESLGNILPDYQEFLEDRKTRVSLCGRFNAGKSALINAILSDDIVTSKAIPSTGVITRIYYDDIEKFSFIRHAGEKIDKITISNTQLHEYTVKDNFQGGENVINIHQVDIGLPNELLRNIDLYDTPGLDDDKRMDTRTHTHLNKSDFIVFVIDVLQLRDLHELLMRYYNRLGKNVIFVANKMDALDENEQKEIIELAKVYYSGYYNPLTYNSDIFFVSAKNADFQFELLSSFFKNHISKNFEKIVAVSRVSIIKDEILQIYERTKLSIPTTNDCIEQRTLLNDKKILGKVLMELNQLIINTQLS